MAAVNEDDEAVNVGEWCRLLDESLARFDRFIGNLKD